MKENKRAKIIAGRTISLLLIIAICSALAVSFIGCNAAVAVDTNNVLKFYELKPGTYEVVIDKDGNLAYEEIEGGERTIFSSIPTDEENVKELAYQLYAIGNKTMVSVPYATFYETGINNSKMDEDDLPLAFETIDVRNNLDGYHFRQTKQFIQSGKKPKGWAAFAKSSSVDAKQWLVEAGHIDNAYKYTKTSSTETGELIYDWTNAEDNNKMNDERKAIALHPIPYTSSGKQGKINGLDQTEAIAETGTYWKYDEATGYSLPYTIDKGGRTIGYERTDQHVFYSTGADADKDGVEDYYNTIKSASVTYNAEGGYYEVNMVMDSTKEYTHIDTLWALRDDGGTKDPNARFTYLEITFQLWDNGYFKQWDMWEKWECDKAHGFVSMSADQHYTSYFSYAKEDASFESYLEESGLAIGNYDPDQGGKKGLSAGAIAGIVIGCVAGVAIIVLGSVFGAKAAKRKKLQANSDDENVENGEDGGEETISPEEYEISSENNDSDTE